MLALYRNCCLLACLAALLAAGLASATSSRFYGGGFDGYDSRAVFQSDGAHYIASNACFNGGSFDGYDSTSLIQSDPGHYIRETNCFYGGGFDGYGAAALIQSDPAYYIRETNCFHGGGFDGYGSGYYDYPVPFVRITNAQTFTLYIHTTAALSGTNNPKVVGQLGWLNDRYPGVTNWFGQGFTLTVTGLAEGSNTITVIGANVLGIYSTDSVGVYRETWVEVRPFIEITNAPAVVPYPQSTADISGSNLHIAGELGWVNDQHADATNYCPQGFAATVDNLEHGNNTITVFGTNVYGHATNAVVSIHRETWTEVHPFIEITNAPAVVPYPQSTADISGSNLHIAGELGWVNDQHADATNYTPRGFTATVDNLEHGDNTITVFGTNVYGHATNAVVSVHRKTRAEAEPQIATNALIFPCAGCELYEGETTGIVWLVEGITDETDGTNITITRVTVHSAETTNEMFAVATNVPNPLGQVSWLVPSYLLTGDTGLVVRFEVVDSTALTNSRVFWDNEFTIVPEPALLWLAVFGWALLAATKK